MAVAEKGRGDVTVASLYCRLPELGGRWDQWTGKSRTWGQLEAMGKARKALAAYPDIRSSVQMISPFGGGGRNSDLAFNLVGPDLNRLGVYSDRIVEILRDNLGVVDVDTTLASRKPELQVRIDRDKASQFGLRIEEIAVSLQTLVGGKIVGTYKENDDQYDVWLRAEQPDRSTAEALQQVYLRSRPTTPGGRAELVQLGNFVRFEEARGPNQIDRFQRQRQVKIIANLGTYSLREAVAEVERIVAGINLPPITRWPLSAAPVSCRKRCEISPSHSSSHSFSCTWCWQPSSSISCIQSPYFSPFRWLFHSHSGG